MNLQLDDPSCVGWLSSTGCQSGLRSTYHAILEQSYLDRSKAGASVRNYYLTDTKTPIHAVSNNWLRWVLLSGVSEL
jgi:hypothetical protein